MNIILTRTLEYGPQTECVTICTMIMLHLLLARSKSENDASITQTFSRKIDQWIRCKLDDLFFEAKALQERLRKLNRKREVDEIKFFDEQMESVKISSALRCLSDNAKSVVLSTSDKMTIKGKKLHHSRSSTGKASM